MYLLQTLSVASIVIPTIPTPPCSKQDEDDSEEDEESMALFVKKFKRFMKKKNYPRRSFPSKKLSSKEGPSTLPTCYECGKPGHMKMDCPNLQSKGAKVEKRYLKEKKGRRAYIAWEDNDMDSSESSDNEEAQLCLMADNEDSDSEVDSFTSNTSYDELHDAFIELHNDSLKLVKALSKSKKSIEFLQNQVIALTKEKLELKKENYSLGYLKVNHVCEKCIQYEKENKDLKCIIEKFTNSTNGLNALLGNGKAYYDKAGLGYKPHAHEKSFQNVFVKPLSSTRPYVKGIYYTKNTHSSYMHTSKYTNVKKVWIPKGSLPYANQQGPKKIWVPKQTT